jgi:hypothetical protein
VRQVEVHVLEVVNRDAPQANHGRRTILMHAADPSPVVVISLRGNRSVYRAVGERRHR